VDELEESLLLRALKGSDIERHPVWFMRQAGRYLNEYRKLKGTRDIFEVQHDPVTASDITVLPVKKLGVDAAVLYSDIMVPIKSRGYEIRIEENIGPVADKPLDVSDTEALNSLSKFDCGRDAPYVLENIRYSIEKLPEGIPLIGFSGGPFTMFSYLIEGRPSRTFEKSRKFMAENPKEFKHAMESAEKIIKNYLRAQIYAGVEVVQLFESWAGYLTQQEYRDFVLEPTKRIFDELPSKIPKIYFSARTEGMIDIFSETGCDSLSVDSNTDIAAAYRHFDGKLSIQGNLSPEIARAGGSIMEKEVNELLDNVSGIRKFVFNLSHGVLKETDPANLVRIVDIVKARRMPQ
jgi:uroporphyrinogen decarboxylase